MKKNNSTSVKLEDGILAEGIGREHQGHFLDLTLVSNRGFFVLMLHFKRHLDLLGEKREGRPTSSSSGCALVRVVLQAATEPLLSHSFYEGPLVVPESLSFLKLGVLIRGSLKTQGRPIQLKLRYLKKFFLKRMSFKTGFITERMIF